MNIFIVDDERLARQEVKNLLNEYPDVEIIGETGNAMEAAALIKELKPDLVFLDIQMPGKTGFEVLEELDGASPEVIFVTAYDEYALKAFQVNALDYLMKPVEEHRMGEAIAKVKKKLLQRNFLPKEKEESGDILGINDQVFLKDGEKCWFVELSRIRLFESEGNYVRVYFEEFRPLILKSLNGLSERLSEKYFFRASRKHIVNLRWIDKVETWFNGGLLIILKDGTKVEVSRRQAVKLKEKMAL